MYDDPKHIKDNRINARFSDDEYEDLIRVTGLTALQKSTLVRKATMKLVAEIKAEFERNLTDYEDAV